GFEVCELGFPLSGNPTIHVHRLGWLNLLLEGSLSERRGPATLAYSAGEILVRNPASPEIHCIGCRGARLIAIEPGRRRRRELWPIFPSEKTPARIHSEVFDGTFRRIVDELGSNAPASKIALSSSILELCAAASRLLSQPSPRCLRPEWLRGAVRLVEERFAEPIGVTGVAREVGVHPVRLAQEFKRLRGCSMGAWLRRRRIAASVERLLFSAEPVRTIAKRSGFHDSSHLIREFRRVVGTTPGAFRRGRA
ncbi:MAG TPA: AraC family transcriptional regulator, partial [Thermoanaerobaculia bacterium]|nr:AraC family transcriptional regulator [Thermoanaerobaculia bacterium]